MGRHRRFRADSPLPPTDVHVPVNRRVRQDSAKRFLSANTASAKNSPPDYAGHIGRVGALAIVLGIGGAVTASPGIASADITGTTTTSSTDTTTGTTGTTTNTGTTGTTSSSTGTTGTTSSSTGTTGTTGSSTGTTSSSTGTTGSTGSTSAASTTPAPASPSLSTVNLGDGVVLSSSGGARTGADSGVKATIDLGGGAALSSSGGALTSTGVTEKAAAPVTSTAATAAVPVTKVMTKIMTKIQKPARKPPPRSNSGSDYSDALLATPQVRIPHPTAAVVSGTTSGTPIDPNLAPRALPVDRTETVPVVSIAEKAATTPSPIILPSPVDSVPTIVKAADQAANLSPAPSVVHRALTVLLGPLFEPGTDGPTDSPLMWALLAAARRQIGSDTELASAIASNPLRSGSETADTSAFPAVLWRLPDDSDLGKCSDPADSTGTAATVLGAFTSGGFVGYWTPADFGTSTTSLSGAPFELQLSPDSTRIFTFIEAERDDGPHRGLVIIDSTTNVAMTVPVAGSPSNFTVSPDSSHAFFLSRAGDANTGYGYSFIAVDAATGAARNIPLSGGAGSIAVSPDSSRVYIANGDTIMVYDTASGIIHSVALAGLHDAGHITFSPNGSHAYVTGRDDAADTFVVGIVDTATEKIQQVALRGLPAAPLLVSKSGEAFVLTPDGAYGGSPTPYHDVTVIDPMTATSQRIPLHGKVTEFLQTPDGSHVIAASDGLDGHSDAAGIHIIDTATHTKRFIPLRGWGPSLAVSPNGDHLLASTYVNGEYQLSTIDTPSKSTSPLGRVTNPSSLVMGRDGARAYVLADTEPGGGRHRAVTALNTATNSVEQLPVGQATRLVVSPDGRYLVAPSSTFEPDSHSYRYELAVIDTVTGTLRSTVIPMPGPAIDISFSPDGSAIYVTNHTAGEEQCAFSLTAIDAKPRTLVL